MDILKCLIDPYLPTNVILLNTEYDINNYKDLKIDYDNVQIFNKATRFLFQDRNDSKIN